MFFGWLRQRNRNRLTDPAFAFLFEPYEGDEVIVLDTETTGLDTKKDEILSIGAVRVKGNKILTSQTFERFIRPSVEISKESIEIHGIRPCDLDHAIAPEEAISELLHFIGNRPLVGYYLEFDVKMLNRYVKPRLGITLPNRQIEVSGLYHDLVIERIPQGHVDLRFETIMEKLKLPKMGQHNAVNDAIMTAMIYLKLQARR